MDIHLEEECESVYTSGSFRLPPSRNRRTVSRRADVHVSPHSENNFNLFMRGPQTRAGRYEIRTATMVDLVGAAYGIDTDKVFGGPNWLELDRYDITAKLPEGATKESHRAMLQALLAERFHLVVKEEKRPMPAYILTAGKNPKLADGDPDGPKSCKGKPRPQGAPPTYPNEVTCTNQTAAEIANDLHDMAGGYCASLSSIPPG